MTKHHYNPLINPTTGDYIIEKGDTVRDESLQFAAYARLKIRRGTWLYAPDNNYGSLYSIVKKRNPGAASLLQNITENALKPLLDDNRATDITVEKSESVGRYDSQMLIHITDKNQKLISFEYQPVGV